MRKAILDKKQTKKHPQNCIMSMGMTLNKTVFLIVCAACSRLMNGEDQTHH